MLDINIVHILTIEITPFKNFTLYFEKSPLFFSFQVTGYAISTAQ